MNNPDYETIYGVGLLDDIHNYFPAILYDNGRFQSLPSMMSYLRTQMNNRFNLFTHGATRAGFRRNPLSHSHSERDDFILPGRVRRGGFPVHQQPMPMPMPPIQPNESETALRTLLQFLNEEGLSASANAVFQVPFDFNTPVTVAPSQTILRMNTRVISGSSASLQGSTCTICQDAIMSSDTCRSLTPCGHIYHKTCIDQWFLRSVFCPTCRHDIRSAVVQSPRLSATPAANANPDLPQL